MPEEPARLAGTAGPLGARPVCTPRSETVVERMLSNWMSICLYQYLKVGPRRQGGLRGAGGAAPHSLALVAPPGERGRPRLTARAAPGQRRRAALQALQGHQAPGGEGPGGRRAEEGQVHPQRHGAAGGRRGVRAPGEPGSRRSQSTSLCWGDPPGAMAQACCRPVWGPAPRGCLVVSCAPSPGPCELGGMRGPLLLCSILLGQGCRGGEAASRVQWGLPPAHWPFIPYPPSPPADSERDRPGRRGGRHPRQGAQLRHHLPGEGEDHRPGVPHAALLPLAQGGQRGPG